MALGILLFMAIVIMVCIGIKYFTTLDWFD